MSEKQLDNKIGIKLSIPTIGEVILIDVLVRYDVPLVFCVMGERSELYLFQTTIQDDTQTEWLVIEVSYNRYLDLKQNRITLQDAFKNKEFGKYYLVSDCNDGKTATEEFDILPKGKITECVSYIGEDYSSKNNVEITFSKHFNDDDYKFLIHPTETILDFLETHNIEVDQAHKVLGFPKKQTKAVLEQKKRMPVRLMDIIENKFGLSKTFWENLYSNYEKEYEDVYFDKISKKISKYLTYNWSTESVLKRTLMVILVRFHKEFHQKIEKNVLRKTNFVLDLEAYIDRVSIPKKKLSEILKETNTEHWGLLKGHHEDSKAFVRTILKWEASKLLLKMKD